MTTQEVAKTVRIASEARHQAMVDSMMTPELRKKMQKHGKQIGKAISLQIKTRDWLPPSLEALAREQNQRIADMLDTSGMRRAFTGIDFDLPEGLVEQVAAYREQVMAEAATAEGESDASGDLGRLVEQRDATIVCLQRIGFALEGFAYLPRSPIPHLVGYLILMLAVLGEVADERLSEREGNA